ncbi:hypothetical protein ILYODFUR_026115 [Ilyodon furcidens]|uniref:Uncharacterized protein n=1 Tax=Ilyodon furcidens TaxID=33524 RepID=A0ABV0TB54_9TELE
MSFSWLLDISPFHHFVLLQFYCLILSFFGYKETTPPPLIHHLNVVEGFECWNDPRGYVVWGLNVPGRVSHGKQAPGDGSDKERFKTPSQRPKQIEESDVARHSRAGVLPWSQAWGRDSSESAR